MIKYRFKTKEEFIKEYGDDWRRQVEHSWVKSMDYLFGLPKNELNLLDSQNSVEVDGWTVSRSMITTVDNIDEVHIKITDNKTIATYGEYSATAKWNKKDKYDKNIGIAIALSRLARKMGEYEIEQTIVVKEKHNILDEI